MRFHLLLIAWACFLITSTLTAHCQTAPTTPCANGQPWKFLPNAKYKWQCPQKIACAHTCTDNAAAPAGSKCVYDFRKDATFVQGQKARGTPVPFAVDDPDLTHTFIYGPDHTWDLNIQRDRNGFECSYKIHFYYGEWPLGDPRNLLPLKPSSIPIVPTGTTLSTELLPLK